MKGVGKNKKQFAVFSRQHTNKGCNPNLTALFLILSFAFCIFGIPQDTYADVTALDAWTNIHSSNPGSPGGTINAGNLTVSSGSNRLFLAAVCLKTNVADTVTTLNVTLDGTALTTIGTTGATSTREHCYMGYLKESQIPAGAKSLQVVFAISTNNVTGIHVKWASYSYVDQTTPVNDSNANTSSVTSVTFGAQIDYLANGLSLYVAANMGTPATMTPPSGSGFSQVGPSIQTHNHSSFIAATANHGSDGNYASTTNVSFGGTTGIRAAIVVAAIKPSIVTTVGAGIYLGDFTIPPGSVATELDDFTLKTSGGTDTVTGVTVSLSAGNSGVLSLVKITSEDGLTVYGSGDPNQDPDPDPDKVLIPLDTNIEVSTTETHYRVWITPKSHTDMPAPPGSTYGTWPAGTVTGITSTNPKVYNDTPSASIAIDNQSPEDTQTFSGIPGDGQVALNWINPPDPDTGDEDYVHYIIILRNTSPVTDKPVEGVTYSQGDPIGTNDTVVIYVGQGWYGESQAYTDTAVINKVTYHYKIFTNDAYGNYSSGGIAAGPIIPGPLLYLTTFNSQVATIEAGSTNQYIGGAFAFYLSSGTNAITALTITDTGSADADDVLKNVKVYYESGVASCAHDPNDPNEHSIDTSFNDYGAIEKIELTFIDIPLSIFPPNYTCIYVVLDVDLLAVHNDTISLQITSSADYTLSGYAIKKQSSLKSLGITTIKDTTPPGNVSDLTATPGDKKITLDWTNPSGPGDIDYAGVRIRRKVGASAPTNCTTDMTGTQVADVPASQTTYTDDNTISNGTQYSYRLCSYDEVPNYSTGATISESPPQVPVLSYPAAPYDDGKDPDTGDTTTDFTFKVIYTDWENDAPASGYPKIYIGDSDGFFSYTMTAEDPGDTTYSDGKTYYFTTGLGAAEDLKFYFEAKAGSGNFTDVVVQLPPTGYSTGPSVYLMQYYNMVGVPKDLGTGLSYSSVLRDDSGLGYSYCIYWDSTGLDTGGGFSGLWSDCTAGNIENGKGYFILEIDPTYRLDEPNDVENVTADYVDIALDPNGGWTIISNPYNANIELQNVKVMREGDPTEYTFSAAVNEPNEWIDNAIYEWEGSVSGYIGKAFNNSPPAILEPWVGYFIYVKDITYSTTLRVHKPVP